MDVIRSGATNHSIIMSHENFGSSPEELAPQAISYLQSRGFTLMTIDQCLGIAPYQLVGEADPLMDETWAC